MFQLTPSYQIPDCLVFKFEEIEINSKKIDTTIYIFYDIIKQYYVIRGQRRHTEKYHSCTYSFNCKNQTDLIDFLQYIFCHLNTINETLYNYDNLPLDSRDITFDFLKDYDHRDYEIAGYDNEKISSQRFLRNLNMLRNISN